MASPPHAAAKDGAPSAPPMLEVRDLHTQFEIGGRIGRAVDGVSFALRQGETLGIVGESGSGKSVMALSILRLLPRPFARIAGGEILFHGVDLARQSERAMRQYRGRRISMVLQDPMTALNPVLTVGDQIAEAIRTHQPVSRQAARRQAVEMLELLRVPAAAKRLDSYPHEFSGGMRQRVVGAIALACRPELLIADEPTTALDVTVQDQYLRLLNRIQRERGLAIIFITHDLAVVARMCDRIAVMYAGRIVEQAPTAVLFKAPRHPYTQALLRSALSDNPDRTARLKSIEGTPPSIFEPRQGCPFAPRCEHVQTRCRTEAPPRVAVSADHAASCWLLA
ncbi:MAG: ABC transporter ATP-binding protein [Reyranellaceae bacterium]